MQLPRRWVVERTFAWLGRYRRNSRDYEWYTESSESMHQDQLDSSDAQALEARSVQEAGARSNTGNYRE